MHILFVDEEPAIQRRVARMLAAGAPHCQLTCASDGVPSQAGQGRGERGGERQDHRPFHLRSPHGFKLA
jgi:hypothetical protein